jgi:hypothetical protein
MPDWSIKIVSVSAANPKGPAKFQPATQECLGSDNISWNNQTGITHQPWPLGPDGQPAAKGWGVKPVPAGESSNPAYSVPTPTKNTIVKYCCKKHPTETGKLRVLVAPPT